MTNPQHIAMSFLIFAALLFMGSSVSSEVDNSLLTEGFVSHVEDAEDPSNMTKKPILQPKESKPEISTYTLKRLSQVCVMAKLGVVFLVKENKKTLYYNLDPKSTRATGYCTNDKAVFSLEFDGGMLEFTFKKVCAVTESCRLLFEGQSYPGILNHEKLFKTSKGKSFKCKSKTQLILAENLSIKLIEMQIQGFDLDKDTFGKEVECWADYTKRIIPIVVGAVVAGIILIAILVYVLMRERRSQGYEQL
ncbi:lysosome-associated membrane glycoprotein 3 [Silurus asotus]|uniref:Lysosome-associated membrane glycoprotein 3 n=1 Tax=Silurus asotus TaxID=30991 RepID=A0AAD5A5Q1_SILAS|nr:lysosome-associated membrane glycoprotein 3 [Silurus asotus]